MTQLLNTTDTNEFQMRIIERLRNDIRDLLPEDTLKQLVERAVQQEFFAERKDGHYNTKPSWFIEEIGKTAKPLVEQLVRDFVTTRTDVIEQAIQTYLTDHALTVMVSQQILNMLNTEMYNFTNNMTRSFRESLTLNAGVGPRY